MTGASTVFSNREQACGGSKPIGQGTDETDDHAGDQNEDVAKERQLQQDQAIGADQLNVDLLRCRNNVFATVPATLAANGNFAVVRRE